MADAKTFPAEPQGGFVSRVDPSAAECVLRDLQDRPLTASWLNSTLAAHVPEGMRIAGVNCDPSTVLVGSHSLSSTLNLQLEHKSCNSNQEELDAQLSVVLKRVCMRDLPPRSAEKYVKDVKSWRVEHSFFQEVAPKLREHGLTLPELLFMDFLDNGEPSSLGFLYLFADLMLTHKPHLEVTWGQMCASMAWTARLHAVFWTKAGQPVPSLLANLWERATYWSLDKRPADELSSMEATWLEFVSMWHHLDPELFNNPRIIKLASRLAQQSKTVDEYINTQGPRTLIHGDLKGAHLFFPDDGGEPAVIDWQWAGFGCPMLDVAYTIHSVTALGDLQGDGEDRLLSEYLTALQLHDITLDQEEAQKLYKSAFLDYARIVVGYFWVDCPVDEVESECSNITELTHTRDVAHVLRFIRRIDAVLLELE